jgi:hypothetical protein
MSSSRALIISIQYTQFPQYKLNGCHNDAINIIDRLKKMDSKISIVYMNDNLPTNNGLYPTRNNIIREIANMCNSRDNEDKLFFFYSGHGTSIFDFNKDERTILTRPNGMLIAGIQGTLKDSCLVSNDINNLNIVVDDEIANILSQLKANKKLYGFLDCCNSGTGFDLYKIHLGRLNRKITTNDFFRMQLEIQSKCNIISSDYPDKKDRVKGNVILISGTRDKDYAYEGLVNGKPGGYFTNALCWLLDVGGWNFNLRKFYLNLIALINLPEQIPVLTCSQEINLDNTFMTDFRYSNNMPKNIRITPNFRIRAINSEKITISKNGLKYFMRRRNKVFNKKN